MNEIEKQIRRKILDFAEFLLTITYEEPFVFDKGFHEKLDSINEMSLIIPEKRPELMSDFYKICWENLDIGMMQRHSREKPLGYPGDYLIIDYIYTEKMDSNGIGKLWDEFYHRQAAPQAVRNRKDYFCSIFERLCYEKQNDKIILDIACGSCRDVSEAVIKSGQKANATLFHCVDMDERAIDYAKQIVKNSSSKVSFQWEANNVFKLRPSQCYDLIWIAGLFDYLDDRRAVILIKKMWKWTKKDGRVIIGNFHPKNSTRNVMEWCCDWFLFYRTEAQMLMLCEQAKIPKECISFDKEPLGVNIFCIITKK